MRGERGSVTVEASIVVMIALFMTLSIFFMATYLYDMQKIQAICAKELLEIRAKSTYHQTQEGTIDWDSWSDEGLLETLTGDYSQEEENLTAELEEACEMWFGNTCSFSCEITAGGAEVSYEGVYAFPLLTGFFGDGGISFSGSVTLDATQPEEWIRLVGGVVRGLGGDVEYGD